jgi:hypothetical protein
MARVSIKVSFELLSRMTEADAVNHVKLALEQWFKPDEAAVRAELIRKPKGKQC